MNLRYRVELSQAKRDELRALISAGTQPVRKAQTSADLAGGRSRCHRRGHGHQRGGGSTVYRINRRFVLSNLEAARSEERSLAGGPRLFGAAPVGAVGR
jgi:hypothetical protein